MLGLGLSLQKGISAFNAGRALVSSYIRRVTDAGGVLQNTACDAAAINELNQDRLLEPASWVLVPDGIEEDVVFAQKPTSGLGDLTFTRASDATYTDSTGVVRRSPYNLLQFSEQFSDGVYTKVATTITANTIVAPNGTLTADKLVSTSASSSHSVYQNLGNVGDVRTISCFVKKAEYRYVNLQYGTAATRFDFDTLTFSGGTNNAYVDYGNGWYRISSVLTAAVNARASIAIPDNSGNVSYVGDNVSGTFIWGFQAVEGTEALDYFPTTNRQDVPRIDFRNADGTLSSCGRLLLEPQRTNSIRNSSMVGAVAGSPGQFPSTWTSTNGGLTRTVVGIGTENGLPYIDVRYNGTTTGVSVDVGLEGILSIAAATGQTWTQSLYFKTITSQPNSFQLHQFEYNNVGGFVTQANQPFSPTATIQRFTWSRALTGATTAFVYPFIRMNVTNGATYDFTIRIAAPQMELGAYATTWVPTTTAAVTRLADAASKTGVSSLIGQTSGTLFVEWDNSDKGLINLLETYNNASGIGGTSSILIQKSLPNQLNIRVFDSLGSYSDNFTATMPNGINKVALAYQPGSATYYLNGALLGSNTRTYVFGSTRDMVVFDNRAPYPRAQAALFPTRLSNDQLEVLTSEGYGTYALLAQSLNCVLQ